MVFRTLKEKPHIWKDCSTAAPLVRREKEEEMEKPDEDDPLAELRLSPD